MLSNSESPLTWEEMIAKYDGKLQYDHDLIGENNNMSILVVKNQF